MGKKSRKKRSFILKNGKKVYITDEEAQERLDSMLKKMAAMQRNGMIILLIIFFEINFLTLNTLYSSILNKSVFVSENIPYLIVFLLMFIWAIYIVLNYFKNPSMFFLFTGIAFFVESICLFILGTQMLYVLLGKESIGYILVGGCVYIFNFILNVIMPYIYIKKGYSKDDKKIEGFRIADIVITFAIGLIFSMVLKSSFHEYIAPLYPNMVKTEPLSYASITLVLSQLIVVGTTNIFSYKKKKSIQRL